jgi:hypothetical protein
MIRRAPAVFNPAGVAEAERPVREYFGGAMAGKPCDARDRWRELTQQERLEALRELFTRLADDYEVPPPDVERGPAPDNPLTPQNESTLPAAYDPETNTIFIHQTGDNFDQVLQNAGHEFAHEMFNDLFGITYDKDSSDELEDFNSDSEDFAVSEQDAFASDLEDECEGDFSESPGESDSKPGDWNMPPENYA